MIQNLLKSADIRLSVIGLGKLGLPLLALLSKSGYKVLGYDKNSDLLSRLQGGEYEFHEPGLNDLLLTYEKNFKIVDSLEIALRESDVIFVIVPTPTDSSSKFSNHHILDVIDEFSRTLKQRKQFCILNIVSTVMPNSCAMEFIPRIESISEKRVGVDFGLTYNPEFIALGSVIRDMEYPDMHLIGSSDQKSGELVQGILKDMSKNSAPSMLMNLTEAELVKISVNNFVTMKISFANMLMQLASSLKNVNVDTVTNAIGLDSRIGKKYLRAGTAYGGPCFPRDTRAMSALFKDYLLVDSLPKVVGELNEDHNSFLTNEIAKIAKRFLYTRVGILGLSYKEDSNVLDESPGILTARRLSELGLVVLAWDPMSNSMPSETTRGISWSENMENVLQETQLVVLPRLVSLDTLNQILHFSKPLTIFDPWGQVPPHEFGSHVVFQPGRTHR